MKETRFFCDMLFVIEGKDFKYELEKLSRLFLPFQIFRFSDDTESLNDAEYYIHAVTKWSGSKFKLLIELSLDGKYEKREETADSEMYCEQRLSLMLFDCFVAITKYRPPWGVLTGIRPAKLLGRFIARDGYEKTKHIFKEKLFVDDEKTELCFDCYNSEEKIINRSTADSFSLYISIPFCPSRCNYCSFVSHSVQQAEKLIPEYINVLCKELKETGEIAKKLSLKLKTVYIGGGTPTTLTAEQLFTVMSAVSSNFNLSDIEEYTVEAGRPDTITEEKLKVILNCGATRISINPQTMNDQVLEKIGRQHTVKETVDAFNLARKVGFKNINMDLIACLSGDSFESFANTVDSVIALSPENVTVHCLTLKRSSNLSKSNTVFDYGEGETAVKMLSYAKQKLTEAGIKPYYMYRQSKTVGNLENVGYAKEGYEGLYNVYIMDETHTILACGASAVTKLREPNGEMIERVFNFKYPYEYINRYDELSERKKRISEFYSKYPIKA